MTEQIGKITLDYKHYPGEDLYCDGVIEDEILDIVKKYPASEYARVIEKRASWPILYHLSPLRENIVDWIPMDQSMKVLEVGSGCGAITGALSRKAREVTCIELSEKRSLINAYRHRDCENVTIQLGNFKDIERELPRDYDYIFLIGVFEYGQGYMGTDTPYEDFMAILKKHMCPGGRMVIAIENKLGMKYWAGCREDHYGTYFSGIEDYPDGGGVRTFTRRGLEQIMKTNGIKDYSFYYPYPDYKFMTTVFSDAYLPQVGELSNNLRNFDRDRLQLFDEKNAFDNVIREGVFDQFSNSYAVVIGEPLEIKYAKFSNDRSEEYAIRTEILQDEEGNRAVFKIPLNEKAMTHIQNIHTAGEQLRKRFEGSRFQINQCTMEEGAIQLEYVRGKTLEMLLDECLDQNDEAGFRALVEEYITAIQYHSEMEVNDFDLIFSNIIVREETGEWVIIDYEWTFPLQLPVEKNLFRAMYCYLIGAPKRRKLTFELIKEKLGMEEEQIDDYVKQEIEFQHFVTGNRLSMTEIHKAIGKRSIPTLCLEQIYIEQRNRGREKHVQIYMDRGEGFTEEDSCFFTDEECMVQEAAQSDGENKGKLHLQTQWQMDENITQLRIDPYMEPCIVRIQRLMAEGKEISYESNGSKIGGGILCFATADPNVTIALPGNLTTTVEVDMEITPVSMETARLLCENAPKSRKWPMRKAWI